MTSFNDMAHTAYRTLVAAYERGFGTETSEFVVGNTILALLVIITVLSGWLVFRDIASLGLRLIRMLIAAAVVLFLAGKCFELADFVYPTAESKAHVRDAATSFVTRTWTTLRGTFARFV